jgi:hypothetical protein
MPSRWLSVAIVMFWLAMMGWLTGRELFQRFGARPKLQDTLREAANAGPVEWDIVEVQREIKVRENGEQEEVIKELPLGKAVTRVERDQRTGQYQLEQTLTLKRIFGLDQLVGRPVSLNLSSRVRVNLFGDLQRLSLKATVPDFQLGCEIQGRPHGPGELQVHTAVRFAEEEHHLDSLVKYDGKDLVFSSLCPLDRMPNIRPGQTWEAPMVDPIETILSQALEQQQLLAPTVSRTTARVTVLDHPEGVLHGTVFVPCYVVESRQADRVVRVYVRTTDGLVLRQTASWGTLSPMTIAVIRVEDRTREKAKP